MSHPCGTPALFLLLLLAAGCASPNADSDGPRAVIWDALPVPKDTDAPPGLPATLENDELVLRGQTARTRAVYSLPVTVECDVFAETIAAPEKGGFAISFVPDGSDAPLGLVMGYDNIGRSSEQRMLAMVKGPDVRHAPVVWGEEPFPLQERHWYHLKLELQGGQTLITINGKSFPVAGVTVSPKEFHLQLDAWPPAHRWRVRNLTVR